MTNSIDRAEAEKRLWQELRDNATVMLGLEADDAHFQPMTAFTEPENGQIWFFTRSDTDLARQIGAGQRATMIFQSRRLHACLDGALSIQHDPDRIEKYWNSVVAAWYPDGKDDPLLTLLCFDCVNAQLWITETGPLKFMWEIAKANATGRTPDIGDRADISLH